MTKKDYTKVLRFASNAEQIIDSATDRLVQIIQDSVSALSNMNPEVAVEVMDQIYEQRDLVAKLGQERKDQDEKFVDTYSKNLPDSLELEN